jgi:hypothetical protein
MDVKDMFGMVDELETRALAPSQPTGHGQSLVRQGHRPLLEPDLAAPHSEYLRYSNIFHVVTAAIQLHSIARTTSSTTSST